MTFLSRSTHFAIFLLAGFFPALAETDGIKQPGDASKGVAAPKAGEPKVELRIPPGQPQKSLHIPIYGADGKQQMNLKVGVATKLDQENLWLQNLRVETYAEDGKSVESDMTLADAIYHTKTKIISSQGPVTVKQPGMEIVGQAMSFRMTDRTGSIEGAKVRIPGRGTATRPDNAGTEISKPPTTPSAPWVRER